MALEPNEKSRYLINFWNRDALVRDTRVGAVGFGHFLNKMLRIPICMEFRCDIVATGRNGRGDETRCQKAREAVTNAVHNQITKQRVRFYGPVEVYVPRDARDTALETRAMYENASLIKERMSRLHTTS